MRQSRLRVFAGPNGSGKSTLFTSFSEKYDAGYFLNADNIEKELATNGCLNLSEFKLDLKQEDLLNFLNTDTSLSLITKAKSEGLSIDIKLKDNTIVDVGSGTHSYEGALVSAFIRHHLLKNKTDFCFETVMSHPSKVEEIREARKCGYKTYLYFVCTDSPEVNVSRVENRVAKGGHYVAAAKIESRYYLTLRNLINAIESSNKCYLFDNSQD